MSIIKRAISADGSVVASAIDATDMVAMIEQYHKPSAVVTAALGRLTIAASLMGYGLKSADESLTLRIDGDGPIGSMVACADDLGNVKCYATNYIAELPLNEKGKLDVGGAIGRNGMLGIIRDLGLKEPYVGQVPLVNGEVAEDLTQYYATSEQLPTAVALGVLVDVDYTIKAAGGFILQVLPGAYDEDIDNVEKTVSEISSVTDMLSNGQNPREIVNMLLKDYEVEYFDDVPAKYVCDCSRERTDRALISIGKEELTKIIEEDGKAEMTCHFCDNIYSYSKEDLLELLESAK